ncbi:MULTISPECIES: zinc-binding dehydrogenase [unclassified Variovorax]|uniref:quinone oxidoreductase family protein n=1 Tax=unclassified Variovorax TaxID=663243 RepID=UPI001BD226EB|nr:MULTISPECIES: zinc-binding dehydrogenase [unclassified Variovorax]
MKAVRVIPHPDGGRIEVQEIARPTVGPRQVLVRVRASGLNRGEITQAKDKRSGDAMTVGVEFAGEVAEVGSEVTAWREGDRVMGHGRECQAQYVLADPLAIMPVPSTISWTEAASFPNAFITAHDAVITNGQLQPGESILVNGASGGVAWAALQIASLWQARPVMAMSRSAEKLARLAEFGVDVGIDSSRESQVEKVMSTTEKRGVDVIIDLVGAPVFEANVKSMAVGGRYVNVARLGGREAQLDLEQLWLKRLKLIGVTFRTRSEQERLQCVQACARDMLPFLKEGRVRWAIDSNFALDDIHAAHAYMMQAQHFGKIVLTID